MTGERVTEDGNILLNAAADAAEIPHSFITLRGQKHFFRFFTDSKFSHWPMEKYMYEV